MAKKRNFKRYTRNNNKKTKYTELEQLAYKMGQIERGRKSDTRVADSYAAGMKDPVKIAKKPLL